MHVFDKIDFFVFYCGLFFMNKIILSFLILIFANCSIEGYQVDLSTYPELRWVEHVNSYNEEDLRNYAKMIDEMISSESQLLEYQWIRKLIFNMSKNHLSSTQSRWLKELQLEIKGLATALKHKMGGEVLRGFREEDLFIFNIGYDLSAYCTSGVFKTVKGPILFRNLDWEGELLKRFVFETEFRRDGKTLFRSIQFLGQVGVFTALKPGSYALALNYRKRLRGGSIVPGITQNLYQLFFRDGWSAPILLRYTLENIDTFDSANHLLASTRLVAPCYFIIAGTENHEAAILERDCFRTQVRCCHSPYEHPTFCVQTNHDVPISPRQDKKWAENDPLLDESMGMGTIRRRQEAIVFLKSINSSESIDEKLMEMLTTTWPVSNSLTIFSSVISPRQNTLVWKTHPVPKKVGKVRSYPVF